MSASPSLNLHLEEVESLSGSIRRLRFVNAAAALLPAAAPGAHLTLRLPGARRMLQRSYSLIGPPGQRQWYDIAVKNDVRSRGGSAFLHAARPGLQLQASWPRSDFAPVATARKHLLIAGGVGLTPFLSYLQRFRATGQDYELHHCVRQSDVAAFGRWLDCDERVHLHCATPRASLELDGLLARQPLGTHLYVCGPDDLMADAVNAALGAGWPLRSIHSESFGAAAGDAFTVRLARSGEELRVAEHQSLLDCLEDSGRTPSSLCRGGVCGVCVTEVLDGEPEHRDHYLSEAERASGRRIMICVSRARSQRLVLDL